MRDQPIPLIPTDAAESYLDGMAFGVTLTPEQARRARAWARGLLAATDRAATIPAPAPRDGVGR